jgi:hypothetical protein
VRHVAQLRDRQAILQIDKTLYQFQICSGAAPRELLRIEGNSYGSMKVIALTGDRWLVSDPAHVWRIMRLDAAGRVTEECRPPLAPDAGVLVPEDRTPAMNEVFYRSGMTLMRLGGACGEAPASVLTVSVERSADNLLGGADFSQWVGSSDSAVYFFDEGRASAPALMSSNVEELIWDERTGTVVVLTGRQWARFRRVFQVGPLRIPLELPALNGRLE